MLDRQCFSRLRSRTSLSFLGTSRTSNGVLDRFPATNNSLRLCRNAPDETHLLTGRTRKQPLSEPGRSPCVCESTCGDLRKRFEGSSETGTVRFTVLSGTGDDAGNPSHLAPVATAFSGSPKAGQVWTERKRRPKPSFCPPVSQRGDGNPEIPQAHLLSRFRSRLSRGGKDVDHFPKYLPVFSPGH